MNNDFDINRARKDTLACNDVVHFNNAGASLMPRPVSDVLHGYLAEEERKGGYEAADEAHELLEGFYSAAAQLFNCRLREIAFVENATRAWQMAFYSFTFSKGDRILTTLAEYGSNVVAYNQQAERLGVEVVFVPNDAHGQIDTTRLADLIDDRVKLISISHIPTGGGLVNPARAVGKIARSADIPFLLDACQTVGQMPLDVAEIGCDIFCGTGRKYLRGPRGTGLLYVNESLLDKLEPPMLDQHAAELLSPTTYRMRPDARRFELWEQYFAGKAALGTAMTYARSFGLDAIRDRIYRLSSRLREKLDGLDGVTVTDDGVEKCGIVTFTTAQAAPADIKRRLANHRINVSTAKGSGSLVSFQHRGLTEVVRASLHYYNTEREVDYVMDTLEKVLSRQV